VVLKSSARRRNVGGNASGAGGKWRVVVPRAHLCSDLGFGIRRDLGGFVGEDSTVPDATRVEWLFDELQCEIIEHHLYM
jgi:hypothetical protein